jgi:hypothetical protein
VIINYLYVIRAIFFPNKAYPEPVINPDAVLSFAVSRKALQPVSGRALQILQILCRIQHP